MKETPTVFVITGPTASGKSALAVELALRLQTEIISADSRQIYKGIPIATAVPSEEEKRGVTHHLLEKLPLDAYYSASMFEQETLALTEQIFKKNNNVIVCGGSMLYIDALCHGIDDLPTVPENIRESLMEEWKVKGDDWLLGLLKKLDENYWNKIDHRNLKRVFHAVEVSVTAGRPYTELLTGAKRELPFRIIKFCLSGDREKLFERINRRVDLMWELGLEQEARNVYPLRHLNSLNTVGIKEMFALIEGRFTQEEALSRMKKNTRVYAKKQLTWHKRDTEINYLDFEKNPENNVSRILGHLI